MIKKYIFCLVVIVCGAVTLPTMAMAEGSWIIDRAHSVLTVTKEGDVHVNESITVDFEESHKTGIIRNIPLKYTVDKSVWFAEVRNIKVQRNQVDEVFSVGGDSNRLSIEIGDSRLDLSGVQKYTITYSVKGALRHSGKTDFLYWNSTGNWETTVRQATAVVVLPKDGLVGQQCEVWHDSSRLSEKDCQSVGLTRSEGRFVAIDSLHSNAQMNVRAEFDHNLVPVAVVQPPSFMDAVEVYKQPLIILVIFSSLSLFAAGILWLKARRIRQLAENK